MNPVFKKYSSFDNHYDTKLIARTRESLQFLNKNDVIWDVTEKVHGAHFCLTVYAVDDDNIMVCAAKRSTIILDPDEKFFNYKNVLEKYKDNAIKAFKIMRSMYPTLTQIDIHGELYGGTYPNINNSNSIAVQKGIYYTPNNEFYAFDIYDGIKYIDTEISNKIFEECEFFYAKPLFSGTLDEVLNYENTFNSTIPAQLGLKPPIGDNIAEGVVLKPREDLKYAKGGRIMIKSKTPTWSEKVIKKQKIPTNNEDPVISEVWCGLSQYVTLNRLYNIQSRGLKDKECIGPLANDALDEFLRCHDDDIVNKYNNLDKLKQRDVRKKLSAVCINLIVENKLDIKI